MSELDDGFMRPEYPEQVIFSYYEASLVFQVIEDRHGFDAIRAMLGGYRRGRTTEELFESVLGTSLERLRRHVRRLPARALRGAAAGRGRASAKRRRPTRGIDALQAFVPGHPGDLLGRIGSGAALVRDGALRGGAPAPTEALRIFPEYGGPGQPLLVSGPDPRGSGRPGRAAAALARLNALSESNYAALLEEADLHRSCGRTRRRGPVAASGRSRSTPTTSTCTGAWPSCTTRSGDQAGAVRERRAVVALDPADRAEALYRLALAQLDAGDRTEPARTRAPGPGDRPELRSGAGAAPGAARRR